MQLEGKRVVITGASQGIGAALARAFAEAGSRVVLAARSVDKLEALAAETGGAAHPVDLLDDEQTEGFIAAVESSHGPIDVLVNNAGIETSESAATTDVATIRDVVRLNVEAPMVLTRSVLPGMLERRSGHLVFLSSLAGTASFPTMSHYAATKAAVTNFAGSVRWETRKHGVGVTIVAPGPVDTDMWDRVEELEGGAGNVRRRFEHLQLLPKLAPDDLAEQTVDAVRSGKRHVRHPKRLSTQFWLNEAPRRIVEAALTGVRYDPTERR